MRRCSKIMVTALVLACLFTFAIIPVWGNSHNEKTYDPWAWTRENLDSGWMEWGKKYWPTEPVRGGYLRTASPVYIGLFNPNHWPVNDWSAIGLFYEGLQAFDGEYRQELTWVMEAFKFESPTVLIMKIKRGITFHDDTVLTAHSVKYIFDWIGDKSNGAWTRGQQRRIKSLEALDDYTLRWETHDPWGSFPQGFFAFMISPKALAGDIAIRKTKTLETKTRNAGKKLAKLKKKNKKVIKKGGEKAAKAENKIKRVEKKLTKLQKQLAKAKEKSAGLVSTDKYPVGTGQYILEEARPGNYLKAKRNPNWWFGKSIGRPEMPYFDGTKVIVIPDPSIQLANLKAGKIDVMGVSKSLYSILKKNPALQVDIYPNNNVLTLIFNQKDTPLKDIRVRKAISHAIDRTAIAQGIEFGLARVASSFWPEDHWAHNPNLSPVKFDPELSKKLLKEAGYPKGLELSGAVINLPDSVTLGEAIKGMLSNVGIQWKMDQLDPVAVNDRIQKLKFDMVIWGDIYMQDPDASISNHYHPSGPWNKGRNNNEQVAKIIVDARHEVDKEKRQKMYWEIEKLLSANYEDAWLYWGVATVARRKVVQGWNNDMWIKYRTWYTNSHPMWFKDGRP